MSEKHALGDERRRFKRFKVKQKSSFVVNSDWPALGEIIDISEGGLSFSYSGPQKWSSEALDHCMVFGNHDSCLNNMPMVLVSDQADGTKTQNSIVVRRRCMKFGSLSKEQSFLLECFIWINGVAEC